MNKILFFTLVIFLNFATLAWAKLPYDFSDTHYIPIKMSVLNEISSNGEIYEGQEIKLKVKNNIVCHGCLLVKKGTIAKAKIGTIVTKGMNGFPAEIILNDFDIDGIKDTQLMGEYIKTGMNFALFVYPIKWALTPIPFVGSLTNFIRGTEAHIESDDIIIVKYYPHWK